jgi:hypothetical protein
LAFLLSISAKLIWILLFRDPAAFLWFKRPARGYQGIVYGTVVLTTIPNILVHVWALLISLENKWNSITPVGVEMAVFATVSLIPPTGFAWWMAWKFLLGAEDGEEDFQPTVKSFGAERQTVSSSDAVHNCNTFVFTDVADGFLNRAYEAQRLIPRTTTPSSITYSAEAGAISPTREERALVEEPRGLDQTPLNGQSNAPRPPRCQTIARFEYMSQSHSGFLSWFSYPIFRLILLVITTIFLIAVLVLVYEDSHYRFRTPQP